MRSHNLHFLFISVFFSCVFLIQIIFVSGADVSLIERDISEAKLSVAKGYEAILDVERVGADFSDLLIRLNSAAKLLSEAQMAFDVGNFADAESNSNWANEIAYQVALEARSLEVDAANKGVYDSLVIIFVSFLGVSIVILVSVVGYGFFKRRYYGSMLKMKPEIDGNEV